MVKKTYLENAPESPGVYLFKNNLGKILYVGKAKRLKDRLSYYFQEDLLFGKVRLLMDESTRLDYIQTVSEVDALILEADFIKKFRPKYNEALKDDKNYAYIRVGKRGAAREGDFPTVSLSRKVEKDGAGYFGPYPTGSSIRIVLKLLRRLFGFRDCSLTKFRLYQKDARGCLYRDLGLCSAPCAGQITVREYNRNIAYLKRYLSGSSIKIEEDIRKRMETYSKDTRYELAGREKRRLDLLVKLRELQFSPSQYQENPNLAQDQRQLELGCLINFANRYLPEPKVILKQNFRLEAYDISNTSGSNATASLVVFTGGSPNKEQYRKFRIRGLKTPNDYGMIKEVFHRRFGHPDWPRPDLVLVDGGLGQVAAARSGLPEGLGSLPILGLAKRLERLAIEGQYRTLPRRDPGLMLLKRIRDEAHRFAKNYHKLLRLKNALPD